MGTRRSKWKTLSLRLALVVGTALMAVAVVELGYRVHQFGWGALSPTEMRSLHRLGGSGLLRRAQVPGLRYEHKPNLDTRYHMQPFSTNSLGMRDVEYPLTKPPATFRVAVVGDSWTMGSGVAIEDVYHSLIESRLAALDGPISIEFLNFGVAGYELWDYVGTIEHKVGQFDPDLILVALSGTDKVRRVRGKPRFVARPEVNPFWTLTLWDDFRLQRINSAKKEQAAKKQQDEKARASKPQAPGDSVPKQADPLPKPTMSYLRLTFSELKKACEPLDVPLVVCFLNMAFSPRGSATRAFAKVCDENQIPYRDMSSAFKGYQSKQFWVFRDDHHPNAAGHALFADEVLEYLEEGGFLPR